MIIDQNQSNYSIENLPGEIKVTIQGRKKWGWFLVLLFPFIMIGLCLFPLGIFFAISAIQQYLNMTIVTIIVAVLLVLLYIFTIQRKFFEMIENVFDKETIEVNESQIIVERSGFFGLKTRKTILAEDVKGITGSLVLGDQFGFLNNIPFAALSLGSIMIWKTKSGFRPFWFYGKGLSHSDALQVIEAFLQRYPNYRYTDAVQH